MTRLPLPPADPEAVEAWVEDHLGDLSSGPPERSPAFRGGQPAADDALADAAPFEGYARRRNEVWPPERRGATRLSPWIRHGLLPLPRVWEAAAAAPSRDRSKLRDELLWQEYARHLHARTGDRLGSALQREPHEHPDVVGDPWDPAMACMALTTEELHRDGWLVNQTRMWLASHWTVRHGAHWRDGEDRFFAHLLDGSRAANRLGWQWTVGAATGREYGFSRYQVEKRAPGVCDGCVLRHDCPIEDWPADHDLPRVDDEPARLRGDPDPLGTRGPVDPQVSGDAELVWMTAESLGDADPALTAHPDLPVAFVFDEPLLAELGLSAKRLIFLAECLAHLGSHRDLQVHRGRPTDVLAGRALATTYAPVPGWRRRRARLDVAVLHPWPWLVPPHGGSAQSFTSWRKAATLPT